MDDGARSSMLAQCIAHCIQAMHGGGQARKCMPFNSNRLPVSGVSGPVRENKQLSMSGTRILAFDYPCVVAIHQHWQLGQGSVLCMHVCARTCIYVTVEQWKTCVLKPTAPEC